MPDENETPQPTPRKGCCLWRLIVMIFWLVSGFAIGWTVNELEDQDWDFKATANVAMDRLRSLTGSDSSDAHDTHAKSSRQSTSDEPMTPAEHVTKQTQKTLSNLDQVKDLLDMARKSDSPGKSRNVSENAQKLLEDSLKDSKGAIDSVPESEMLQKLLKDFGGTDK